MSMWQMFAISFNMQLAEVPLNRAG